MKNKWEPFLPYQLFSRHFLQSGTFHTFFATVVHENGEIRLKGCLFKRSSCLQSSEAHLLLPPILHLAIHKTRKLESRRGGKNVKHWASSLWLIFRSISWSMLYNQFPFNKKCDMLDVSPRRRCKAQGSFRAADIGFPRYY
jgi:hypothetical protein